MKNSRKNMIKLTIVILIITIIILVGIIVNVLNTNNEINRQKEASAQQLTERTSDNAYVDITRHLKEVEDGINDGYNKGYTEGYSDGQNNAGKIEYIYHTHKVPEGATISTYNEKTISSIKGECYTEEEKHTHSGNTTSGGGCYKNSYRCTGTLKEGRSNSTWCNVCGACNDLRKDGNQCEKYFYSLSCGYSEGLVGYSCPKIEGVTIEGAIIKY